MTVASGSPAPSVSTPPTTSERSSRGGSWEVGLRIARPVTPAQANGRPKNSSIAEFPGRVGAVTFAREAGISETTVRRYLSAWEWAAADGLVRAVTMSRASSSRRTMPRSAK